MREKLAPVDLRVLSGTAALQETIVELEADADFSALVEETIADCRGKESRELGHRAHRLASKTDAGRRSAMHAGLGSKT